MSKLNPGCLSYLSCRHSRHPLDTSSETYLVAAADTNGHRVWEGSLLAVCALYILFMMLVGSSYMWYRPNVGDKGPQTAPETPPTRSQVCHRATGRHPAKKESDGMDLDFCPKKLQSLPCLSTTGGLQPPESLKTIPSRGRGPAFQRLPDPEAKNLRGALQSLAAWHQNTKGHKHIDAPMTAFLLLKERRCCQQAVGFHEVKGPPHLSKHRSRKISRTRGASEPAGFGILGTNTQGVQLSGLGNSDGSSSPFWGHGEEQ